MGVNKSRSIHEGKRDERRRGKIINSNLCIIKKKIRIYKIESGRNKKRKGQYLIDALKRQESGVSGKEDGASASVQWSGETFKQLGFWSIQSVIYCTGRFIK